MLELDEPLLQPVRRTPLEELARRRAILGDEVRQEHLADVDLERAALRDLDGVGDRLGQIREQLGHLGRRAQVLLLAVGARSAWIVERDALRDADARLVRFEVVAREEAHVVRRDDGHGMRGRGLDGASEIFALAGPS